MLGLETGQTWSTNRISRLILEARGYSVTFCVTFCRPLKRNKTWTVTPSDFVKWAARSGAKLVAGPGSNK